MGSAVPSNREDEPCSQTGTEEKALLRGRQSVNGLDRSHEVRSYIHGHQSVNGVRKA